MSSGIHVNHAIKFIEPTSFCTPLKTALYLGGWGRGGGGEGDSHIKMARVLANKFSKHTLKGARILFVGWAAGIFTPHCIYTVNHPCIHENCSGYDSQNKSLVICIYRRSLIFYGGIWCKIKYSQTPLIQTRRDHENCPC